MNYGNDSMYELRSRFAVRVLGWTWWRSKRDGLAVLIAPPPRTRWNFAESLFDPVEVDATASMPVRLYDDAFAHLYDNHQDKRDSDDYANTPTFFDPSFTPPGSARRIMYIGANMWRVIRAMRECGFAAQVYVETHSDPQRTQVNFYTSQNPYQFEGHRSSNPERAALIAALRCLDAAADVAPTPPAAPAREGE